LPLDSPALVFRLGEWRWERRSRRRSGYKKLVGRWAAIHLRRLESRHRKIHRLDRMDSLQCQNLRHYGIDELLHVLAALILSAVDRREVKSSKNSALLFDGCWKPHHLN